MDTTSYVSDDIDSYPGFFENNLNKFLDLIFSLTPTAGGIRSVILIMLFFGIWLILSLLLNSPGDKYVILLPFIEENSPRILQTLNHLLGLMFAWNVIVLMSAMIAGFYIANHISAIYLADIFNLEKYTIARKFINQTAFSTLELKCIHIENGNIRNEDLTSPVVRIGGPGCVQINLENAVVFEKIDGTPRICGPTTLENVKLDGFERIRKIIDLRDHTTKLNIKGRTRDGIRVSIDDIRLLFSVYRDNDISSLSEPYSYNTESLYWLVYRHGPGVWTNSIINLVKNELVDFISQHTLNEILATVGEPEIAHQINHQNNISLRMRVNRTHSRRYKIYRKLYPGKKLNSPGNLPIYYKTRKHPVRANKIRSLVDPFVERVNFSHRNHVSKLFYKEFSKGFYQRAKNQGIRLNWINVGTWYAPGQTVAEQHLEAWKIISQNQINSNPKVMASKFENQRLISLADNIRQLPIHTFIHLREKRLTDVEVVNRMIDEYAGKLKSGRDLFLRTKGRVPIQIENALNHIRKYQINNLHQSGYFIGEEKSEK